MKNLYIIFIIGLMLAVTACPDSKDRPSKQTITDSDNSQEQDVSSQQISTKKPIDPLKKLKPSAFSTIAASSSILPATILSDLGKMKVVSSGTCIKSIEFPSGVSLQNASVSDFKDAIQRAQDANTKKYISVFYVATLSAQADPGDVLKEINAIKSSNLIKYKYQRLTDIETVYTYFSDQSLNNLLGIYEYMAKLNKSNFDPDKEVTVALAYLSDRRAFLALLDLFSNDLDERMMSILSDWLARQNDTTSDHIKLIWNHGDKRYFTVISQNNAATVAIDRIGGIEVVEGKNAVNAYKSYLAEMDLNKLGINDIMEPSAQALIKECKKREYKESLKGYIEDYEDLLKAYHTNKTEEYMNDYATTKVANKAMGSIQGEIPFNISVKIKDDEVEFLLNSPCGFSFPVGKP